MTAGEAAPAFDVTATDDDSAASSTESATITFTNINDAPDGADATLTINEDVPYTFAAADFGFNDADTATGPDSLSAVIISSLPTAGTLELGGIAVAAGDSVSAANIGQLVFTPAQDANGLGNRQYSDI